MILPKLACVIQTRIDKRDLCEHQVKKRESFCLFFAQNTPYIVYPNTWYNNQSDMIKTPRNRM